MTPTAFAATVLEIQKKLSLFLFRPVVKETKKKISKTTKKPTKSSTQRCGGVCRPRYRHTHTHTHTHTDTPKKSSISMKQHSKSMETNGSTRSDGAVRVASRRWTLMSTHSIGAISLEVHTHTPTHLHTDTHTHTRTQSELGLTCASS